MSTWVAEVDTRIRSDIARRGVHVIGSQTADGMPWLHTIGLQAHPLPELVLVGLPWQMGHEVLNAIAAWCAQRRSKPVTPGQVFTVPDYNPDLRWKAAPVSVAWCAAHMNKMHRFYPQAWQPGEPASVVQVLWPDDNGNHPGQFWNPAEQPQLADWAPNLADLFAAPHRPALMP